jgi:hypothetical protein
MKIVPFPNAQKVKSDYQNNIIITTVFKLQKDCKDKKD